MEMKPNEEFLAWADERGIGLRSSGSNRLQFVSGEDESRFWVIPFEPIETLAFVSALLDTMDEWQSLWAYTEHDYWTSAPEDYQDTEDKTLDTILHWTGIPEAYCGSVRYDSPDRANLILLMLAAYRYGFHGFHDVFFVPDHGRQFLLLSHESVIFVFFADKSEIDSFVARMSSFGFSLPTEPPSPFAWTRWMGEKPADWKYAWEKN